MGKITKFSPQQSVKFSVFSNTIQKVLPGVEKFLPACPHWNTPLFWLLMIGIEVKQTDDVNQRLAEIAKSFNPEGMTNFYQGTRHNFVGFYTNGATDAVREKLLNSLENWESYQDAKKRFQTAKKRRDDGAPAEDTHALTVGVIDEVCRCCDDYKRWYLGVMAERDTDEMEWEL